MAASRDTPIIMKARLQAALRRVKPKDVLMAAGEGSFSELVGMTWGGLKRGWIDPDPDFPLEVRGGNGVKWQIRAVKAINHMIKRCDEKIAANERLNERNAQMAAVELPADERSADITEVAKLVDTTLKVQGAKEKQGHFIPASEVSSFIAGYNAAAVNGVMGISMQVDPTGLLSPEIRAAMDDYLRAVAVTMRDKTEQFIREWDARSKQGRAA